MGARACAGKHGPSRLAPLVSCGHTCTEQWDYTRTHGSIGRGWSGDQLCAVAVAQVSGRVHASGVWGRQGRGQTATFPLTPSESNAGGVCDCASLHTIVCARPADCGAPRMLWRRRTVSAAARAAPGWRPAGELAPPLRALQRVLRSALSSPPALSLMPPPHTPHPPTPSLPPPFPSSPQASATRSTSSSLSATPWSAQASRTRCVRPFAQHTAQSEPRGGVGGGGGWAGSVLCPRE